MQPTEPQCHIIWRCEPNPSAAQRAAWDWLWKRLLGHVDPNPETPQPQDHVDPRAATLATVSGGHHLLSESDYDTTNCTLRA